MNGELRVVVQRATDLKDTDKVAGGSDPFVVLRCGGGSPAQTKVLSGTLNPVWNEEFRLTVPLRDDRGLRVASAPLTVEVFDKDAIGKDILGRGDVDLAGLPQGQPRDTTLPLLGNGRLYLQLTAINFGGGGGGGGGYGGGSSGGYGSSSLGGPRRPLSGPPSYNTYRSSSPANTNSRLTPQAIQPYGPNGRFQSAPQPFGAPLRPSTPPTFSRGPPPPPLQQQHSSLIPAVPPQPLARAPEYPQGYGQFPAPPPGMGPAHHYAQGPGAVGFPGAPSAGYAPNAAASPRGYEPPAVGAANSVADAAVRAAEGVNRSTLQGGFPSGRGSGGPAPGGMLMPPTAGPGHPGVAGPFMAGPWNAGQQQGYPPGVAPGMVQPPPQYYGQQGEYAEEQPDEDDELLEELRAQQQQLEAQKKAMDQLLRDREIARARKAGEKAKIAAERQAIARRLQELEMEERRLATPLPQPNLPHARHPSAQSPPRARPPTGRHSDYYSPPRHDSRHPDARHSSRATDPDWGHSGAHRQRSAAPRPSRDRHRPRPDSNPHRRGSWSPEDDRHSPPSPYSYRGPGYGRPSRSPSPASSEPIEEEEEYYSTIRYGGRY